MTLDVGRRQVLAYRLAAHELDRRAGRAADLAVLDLGVQDTPAGSARLALAARLDGAVDARGLALAWSVRGAPHLHRDRDLPELARALWPLSDADAVARLAGLDVPGIAALERTAAAVRAVLTGPTAKGELSAAVTARIPEALSAWCRGCRATHVHDPLLRLAALPGGARIEPGSSPLTFVPIPRWRPVRPDLAATGRLVATYLRLLGPAGPAEAAAFLGTTRREIEPAWPAGLAEVRVDGRRAWLPEPSLAALRSAADPRAVRLLPPSDPFLQARDRALLVPDRARQRALWRVLGNPGAVLLDGEVAGTWRARSASRGRLDVAVEPFGALPARVRAEVAREAERVADARGAPGVRVRYPAGS